MRFPFKILTNFILWNSIGLYVAFIKCVDIKGKIQLFSSYRTPLSFLKFQKKSYCTSRETPHWLEKLSTSFFSTQFPQKKVNEPTTFLKYLLFKELLTIISIQKIAVDQNTKYLHHITVKITYRIKQYSNGTTTATWGGGELTWSERWTFSFHCSSPKCNKCVDSTVFYDHFIDTTRQPPTVSS